MSPGSACSCAHPPRSGARPPRRRARPVPQRKAPCAAAQPVEAEACRGTCSRTAAGAAAGAPRLTAAPPQGTGSDADAGAASPQFSALESKSAVKVAVVVRPRAAAGAPAATRPGLGAWHRGRQPRRGFLPQVRPLLDAERARGATDVVAVADTCQVRLPARRGGAEAAAFTFDRAYKLANPGRQMFAEVVQPLLQRFVQGFNATVLACGQTGSGKTHAMGTGAALRATAAERGAEGVIPRAVRFLYEAGLPRLAPEYDLSLKVRPLARAARRSGTRPARPRDAAAERGAAPRAGELHRDLPGRDPRPAGGRRGGAGHCRA